jgi:PAS domain S-box-containing protein
LLLEISARAALALENARLHAETLAEVAERKRAEDALRREQHLLQRLIDTIPVMIMVYGPDMRVLRLNREFERVAGWTSEEARLIQLLEVCFPDAEERAELQRFMESPKSGWCDFQMTTRDGRVMETAWAHIRLSEQTHVGIGLDISSRKRAEHERARLYEAERRARDAAERLQTLTAALSEAVSESAVSQVVLRLGVSALGASAGAIALGASDGELTLADSIGFGVDGAGTPAQGDGMATLGPLLAAARAGESVFLASPQEWVARYGGAVECETRGRAWAALPLFIPAGPGALLWAFDEPRPFDKDEQALMHAIARLCTQALERARLFDAERQARESAEAANRSKSQFLGVMSHELRTPLNAVLGYADLLLMEVRGPLTREQRDQVERIRTSARVQLELIEEILSFARIEAGKEQLRVTVTDVRELAREAASILRPQAEQKHLDLRLDAPEPLPVVTDPAKVRQVILNLAGNAVKFTNAGSIDIVAKREGDSIVVHVQQDLIWQPFTQLDQSTTREIGGTGLGLAITRRLTRLLGGSIRVDSVPGTGSTFTVRLPAATMFGEALRVES